MSLNSIGFTQLSLIIESYIKQLSKVSIVEEEKLSLLTSLSSAVKETDDSTSLRVVRILIDIEQNAPYFSTNLPENSIECASCKRYERDLLSEIQRIKNYVKSIKNLKSEIVSRIDKFTRENVDGVLQNIHSRIQDMIQMVPAGNTTVKFLDQIYVDKQTLSQVSSVSENLNIIDDINALSSKLSEELESNFVFKNDLSILLNTLFILGMNEASPASKEIGFKETLEILERIKDKIAVAKAEILNFSQQSNKTRETRPMQIKRFFAVSSVKVDLLQRETSYLDNSIKLLKVSIINKNKSFALLNESIFKLIKAESERTRVA